MDDNRLTGELPHSLTKLANLEIFYFNLNDVCEPSYTAFQTWLNSISSVRGTDICRYKVSGQVTNCEGSSLEGITISSDSEEVAITYIDGTYTLDLPRGTYNLTPIGGGYTFSPTIRTISVPPDVNGQNFARIGCVYTISGRITDNDNHPLTGVSISSGTALANVTLVANNGFTATTNVSGYYTFTNLISKTYILTPTLNGYTFAPATRIVSVPPNQSGQDFTATIITYTITGRVTSDGETLANVTLTASNDITATINVSGYYTFNNLISGTYILTPTLSGYDFTPVTRTVNVPPNQTGQDFVGISNDLKRIYLPLIVKNY